MKSSTRTLNGGFTTNATALTAEFDTQGFNFAKIIAIGNMTNAAATQNNTLVESDTSGGTTNSVSGYVQGTDWTTNTVSAATTVSKMVWAVPLGGRKRYLKAQFAPGATGICSLICELSDAGDTVNTRSTAASQNSVGL